MTLQPAHFGRVYAAYGGVVVVLSLLWGWMVDRHRPGMFAGVLLATYVMIEAPLSGMSANRPRQGGELRFYIPM